MNQSNETTVGPADDNKPEPLEARGSGQPVAADSVVESEMAAADTLPAEGDIEGSIHAEAARNAAEFDMIDTDDLATLIEFGVEEEQAAQALRASGNKGVNPALEWISAQKAQAAAERPRLSPEEARKKALELQAKAKERRLAIEREEARTAEKKRIEQTKALVESRRQFEEAEKRRALQQAKFDREEAARAEAKQREILAQEYKQRFGKEMAQPVSDEAVIKAKSPREQCLFYLGQLKAELKDAQRVPEQKGKLITCLKTLVTYCNNARENPTEAKYHAIRVGNKAFQERVASIPAAVNLLQAAGFKETDDREYLKIATAVPDGFILGECVKFLNVLLNTV